MSIHTNVGAISALQTLRSISTDLGRTQDHISSGFRIGEASDNAAYWSIATTMRSDNRALSAVQDALGLGAAKVDTAYTGMDGVISVISEIKSRIVAATEPGVDRQKVQTEIDQLKGQLTSIVSSSSFNGINWLSTDATSSATNQTSVVASASRDSLGNFSVKQISVDLSDIALFNTAGDGILQKSPLPTGGYGGFENVTTPVDTLTFTGPFTMNDGDEFMFDIQDGANNFTATVSTAAIPTWNGSVENTADFWTLVSESSWFAGLGVFGLGSGNTLQAFGDNYPNPVLFSNFRVTSTAPPFTIMDADVTEQDNLNPLLSRVDAWLQDTIDAAATLGSLSTRVSIQESFVSRLSDTIESGIGRLVDADMNEESTRLKALQTQEQLGIQALSIANSSADSVMQLFN